MTDDLGDRMKDAEFRSRSYLGTRSYVVIRLDGKAFHTYTRGLERPFDAELAADMDETAKHLCDNIQGARCAYIQSDEISILVSDVGNNGTQSFFKNQIQKIVSVTASMAAAKFNQLRMLRTFENSDYNTLANQRLAYFDARVMCFADPVEAHNCLVWRQQDATKNSISMAAQSMFSHKALHGKSGNEMQEMMFQKGTNWNDYPVRFKRGGFVKRETYKVDVKTENKNIPDWVVIPENVERTRWAIVEPPIFTQDKEFTYSCIPVKRGDEVATLWDISKEFISVEA